MSFLKKFPSYDHILNSAIDTIKRFPLTVLAALLATIVSIDLTDQGYMFDEKLLEKLLTLFLLGLPLFTSLQIYSDSKENSKFYRLISYGAGIVILLLYFISLPQDLEHPYKHLNRFGLLMIAFHFLTAFIPYIGGKQINGFWQYNKGLFLRFLMAALYSAVLYLGLTIALASADYLFGAEVKPIRYFQLWVIVGYMFTTFLFLSGIPKNLKDLNSLEIYPKGLKIFSQFILMPLVILYFIILISYEIKIIIQWNWPKGWVSELILWYAVSGILTLLLLYPFRNKEGNNWIKKIMNWYYYLLTPMIIMLILAIIRRISDYGITVNRYYVIALAVGLTVVVIYFIFSKVKDIRLIPIVAFTITILSAVGPWSAFSISESSQMNRLEHYLEKNNMLENNELILPEEPVSFDDRKEMSSIVEYLFNFHGNEVFKDLFDDSTYESLDTTNNLMPSAIAKQLGFDYLSSWERQGNTSYFSIRKTDREELSIAGYDYLANFIINNSTYRAINDNEDEDSNIVQDTMKFNSFNLFLSLNKTGKTLLISPFTDSLSFDSLQLQLGDILESNQKDNYNVPGDSLAFTFTNAEYDAKVIIEDLNGVNTIDSSKINSVSGIFLIKWK